MELFGLEYFFSATQRVYWLYLLSAFLIAMVYVRFNPKAKKQFSKELLWHSSARLDYLYFIVVSAIKVALILPFVLSSKDVALRATLFLQESFGFIQVDLDYALVLVVFSASTFVVNDFTRYWLHRFMHEVEFLWKFHRVHHSAQTLNPLTFYRVHPVENALFGLRYALSVGFVSGVFLYFFGAKVGYVEILGVNATTFLFGLAGSNLRHSHIPLRYGIFESVVISPYMHQLHHAKKSANKNYGSVLSVWDTLFQTAYRPKKVQELEFGADVKHNSVLEALIEPFVSIGKNFIGVKSEKSIA